MKNAASENMASGQLTDYENTLSLFFPAWACYHGVVSVTQWASNDE